MKRGLMIIAALVGVFLVGLLLWLYTPDKSRARLEATYAAPATDYRNVAGIRLRVRDTGPRGAPAVILLHGFGSSLETWEPWARRLETDHRVVRFDLPGFGLTGPDPTGDYSDQRAMRILAALMDQLGIRRASLVGNSLGGRIAWTFAANHPDRVDRLVLVSPDGFASPGFEYGRTPRAPFLMKLLPYTLPRPLLRMNLAIAYADPRRLAAATLGRYRDMMLAPGDRAAMVARMEQVRLQDPAPLLARIKAPTLILWGEQDGMIPFANASDYQRDLPGATLVPLPGLGHVPFEEDPDGSIGPVLHFLESPRPRASP
jgi:pimeloyl-ACP methyl ester carboxylesterase